MKKLILLLALFVSVMFTEKTNAQVSFRVNIGTQPMWGPVGYDYVEYYYLPDIEAYYNVSSRRYIYRERNQWVSRSYLPRRYQGYDIYHSRVVVVNEHKPYLRHNDYKSRYSNYQGYSNHQSIRDSRDPRYYESRQHPQHSKYSEYKRTQKKNYKNDQSNRNQSNKNQNNRNQSNNQNNPNHDNNRDKNK